MHMIASTYKYDTTSSKIVTAIASEIKREERRALFNDFVSFFSLITTDHRKKLNNFILRNRTNDGFYTAWRFRHDEN